jgi:hypothetical protein
MHVYMAEILCQLLCYDTCLGVCVYQEFPKGMDDSYVHKAET